MLKLKVQQKRNENVQIEVRDGAGALRADVYLEVHDKKVKLHITDNCLEREKRGEDGADAVSQSIELMQETPAKVKTPLPVPGGNGLYLLDGQQHATVLAALRYYQKQGLGDPRMRPEEIHDIATNADEVISLDDKGIDALCEALNQ